MKYCYSLSIVFLLSLIGCNNDDPAPVHEPQEIIKEQISDDIASHLDLSEFADAFDDLELTAEEVANGLTVFAPADASSGGRTKTNQQTGEITPETLRGHIAKGLVNGSSLNDGSIIEALDGRELYVSVDGDEIRINGVLVTSKDLVKGEKYVIHKVAEIIEDFNDEPASITVTVYNSLLWSPENPKGLPQVGVEVAFYSSQEDYPDGTPVYSEVTDAQGKITFAQAQAGTTYYILAEREHLSNVFNRSAQPTDGVYYGFLADGIFQSQEEIQSAPDQSAATPGNLRWRDLNGDGIISSDDRVALPHPAVTAAPGDTPVEVIIGSVNNDAMYVRDEEDAYEHYRSCLGRTYAMNKIVVMLDGILSDDAECSPGTAWCDLDNFQHTASNTRVHYMWDLGYDNIEELNLLLRDVPALNVVGKEELIAQVKALRGFTYLHLVTYFGDVPIPYDVWLDEGQSRNNKLEVYDLIRDDLEAAMAVLPAGPLADRMAMTADLMKVLLAKLALIKGDYVSVDALTTEVIDNAGYQLVASTEDAYADSINAELIWDMSFGFNQEFTNYFFGRSFGPAIRLAQVYLMNAEAKIELNDFLGGQAALDVIRDRLGLAPSSGVTLEELRAELRETWRLEMSREGDRFFNLVRWNLAPEVLAAKGYDPSRHALLPIPTAVLEKNYNIFQNPGY